MGIFEILEPFKTKNIRIVSNIIKIDSITELNPKLHSWNFPLDLLFFLTNKSLQKEKLFAFFLLRIVIYEINMT